MAEPMDETPVEGAGGYDYLMRIGVDESSLQETKRRFANVARETLGNIKVERVQVERLDVTNDATIDLATSLAKKIEQLGGIDIKKFSIPTGTKITGVKNLKIALTDDNFTLGNLDGLNRQLQKGISQEAYEIRARLLFDTDAAKKQLRDAGRSPNPGRGGSGGGRNSGPGPVGPNPPAGGNLRVKRRREYDTDAEGNRITHEWTFDPQDARKPATYRRLDSNGTVMFESVDKNLELQKEINDRLKKQKEKADRLLRGLELAFDRYDKQAAAGELVPGKSMAEQSMIAAKRKLDIMNKLAQTPGEGHKAVFDLSDSANLQRLNGVLAEVTRTQKEFIDGGRKGAFDLKRAYVDLEKTLKQITNDEQNAVAAVRRINTRGGNVINPVARRTNAHETAMEQERYARKRRDAIGSVIRSMRIDEENPQGSDEQALVDLFNKARKEHQDAWINAGKRSNQLRNKSVWEKMSLGGLGGVMRIAAGTFIGMMIGEVTGAIREDFTTYLRTEQSKRILTTYANTAMQDIAEGVGMKLKDAYKNQKINNIFTSGEGMYDPNRAQQNVIGMSVKYGQDMNEISQALGLWIKQTKNINQALYLTDQATKFQTATGTDTERNYRTTVAAAAQMSDKQGTMNIGGALALRNMALVLSSRYGANILDNDMGGSVNNTNDAAQQIMEFAAGGGISALKRLGYGPQMVASLGAILNQNVDNTGGQSIAEMGNILDGLTSNKSLKFLNNLGIHATRDGQFFKTLRENKDKLTESNLSELGIKSQYQKTFLVLLDSFPQVEKAFHKLSSMSLPELKKAADDIIQTLLDNNPEVAAGRLSQAMKAVRLSFLMGLTGGDNFAKGMTSLSKALIRSLPFVWEMGNALKNLGSVVGGFLGNIGKFLFGTPLGRVILGGAGGALMGARFGPWGAGIAGVLGAGAALYTGKKYDDSVGEIDTDTRHVNSLTVEIARKQQQIKQMEGQLKGGQTVKTVLPDTTKGGLDTLSSDDRNGLQKWWDANVKSRFADPEAKGKGYAPTYKAVVITPEMLRSRIQEEKKALNEMVADKQATLNKGTYGKNTNPFKLQGYSEKKINELLGVGDKLSELVPDEPKKAGNPNKYLSMAGQAFDAAMNLLDIKLERLQQRMELYEMVVNRHAHAVDMAALAEKRLTGIYSDRLLTLRALHQIESAENETIRREVSEYRALKDAAKNAHYVSASQRNLLADGLPQANLISPTVLGHTGFASHVNGSTATEAVRRINPRLTPYQASAITTQALLTAKKVGVDPALFLGLIGAESGFNPKAVSGQKAIGLTQLMPGTAAGLGVNPHTIEGNLLGGARYLKQQLDHYKNVETALMAYNGGPKRADDAIRGKRVPAETRAYPGRVLGYANRFGAFEGANFTGPDMITNPKAVLFQLAHQMGLRVTSGYRPGDMNRTGVRKLSTHGQGRAYDFSGNKEQMAQFFDAARGMFGDDGIEELFYTPKGQVLRGAFGETGKMNPKIAAGHKTHVHVALAKGAKVLAGGQFDPKAEADLIKSILPDATSAKLIETLTHVRANWGSLPGMAALSIPVEENYGTTAFDKKPSGQLLTLASEVMKILKSAVGADDRGNDYLQRVEEKRQAVTEKIDAQAARRFARIMQYTTLSKEARRDRRDLTNPLSSPQAQLEFERRQHLTDTALSLGVTDSRLADRIALMAGRRDTAQGLLPDAQGDFGHRIGQLRAFSDVRYGLERDQAARQRMEAEMEAQRGRLDAKFPNDPDRVDRIVQSRQRDWLMRYLRQNYSAQMGVIEADPENKKRLESSLYGKEFLNQIANALSQVSTEAQDAQGWLTQVTGAIRDADQAARESQIQRAVLGFDNAAKKIGYRGEERDLEARRRRFDYSLTGRPYENTESYFGDLRERNQGLREDMDSWIDLAKKQFDVDSVVRTQRPGMDMNDRQGVYGAFRQIMETNEGNWRDIYTGMGVPEEVINKVTDAFKSFPDMIQEMRENAKAKDRFLADTEFGYKSDRAVREALLTIPSIKTGFDRMNDYLQTELSTLTSIYQEAYRKRLLGIPTSETEDRVLANPGAIYSLEKTIQDREIVAGIREAFKGGMKDALMSFQRGDLFNGKPKEWGAKIAAPFTEAYRQANADIWTKKFIEPMLNAIPGYQAAKVSQMNPADQAALTQLPLQTSYLAQIAANTALGAGTAGGAYADAANRLTTQGRLNINGVQVNGGSNPATPVNGSSPRVPAAGGVPGAKNPTKTQRAISQGIGYASAAYGAYQAGVQGGEAMGAATGAVQGFMLGGPVGAVVGGILGFLGGTHHGRPAEEKQYDPFWTPKDVMYATPGYRPFSAYAGGRQFQGGPVKGEFKIDVTGMGSNEANAKVSAAIAKEAGERIGGVMARDRELGVKGGIG